ncbi:transposase [Janthinobacterium sp. EB271-G4-3-1]|nr:transposase [Janthinobacterium sp. EB271-G4-3-1]MCC7690438.1 transposase [Janthinobacterium sp. EB271-G4-3-2]
MDGLNRVIYDRLLSQYLCPQFSILDTNSQTIISTNKRAYYRQHPLEFKRALVALSLLPGASVARTAREHGFNANQVFS